MVFCNDEGEMVKVYLYSMIYMVVMGIGLHDAVGAGMRLTSPVFIAERAIPKDCTCDGRERSPQLVWTEVPEGTKSLVLIVEDPDAQTDPAVMAREPFIHWIVFNISPKIKSLMAGSGSNHVKGAKMGKNSAGKSGYLGPCPPTGVHRYFFRLYALSDMLDLQDGATKKEITDGMRGKIIEQAELVATYQRRLV
jgi:Raf kinase inhibitor-like YbhB/YbcL family protein